MNAYEFLYLINSIIIIAVSCIFAYQLAFTLIGLFIKTKKYPETTIRGRYAFIIAARNEDNVIGQLIESIFQQKYPRNLIDVYVVADNCTDQTAQVARQNGAVVYERFNKEFVGKGYALDFLFTKILTQHADKQYDAFLIFDADNILTPTYLHEMNKAYQAGEKILTSYRHSKNWHENWLSSGYGLNFMRECRFIHHPRSFLHTSSFVSGTGFLISSEIIKNENGWKYQLLTEDIEFSLKALLNGYKVGFCYDAIFYDEQPTTFMVSWNQRLRWCKGFYQCFGKYGFSLFKGIFDKTHPIFTCYDILVWVSPLPLTSFVWSVIFNICLLTHHLIDDDYPISAWLSSTTSIVAFAFLFTWLLALLVVIKEYRRIGGTLFQKLKAIFTFPFFILTYIPLGIIALFKHVSWTPIKHNCTISVKEIDTI